MSDRLGQNFARHLWDTINTTIKLLKELNINEPSKQEQNISSGSSNKKDKGDKRTTVLKVLEQLNSLIVYLIRLSTEKKIELKNGKMEKSKSKLRRQYSAFVHEGGQFFRIKRSISTHGSSSHPNIVNLETNGINSSSMKKKQMSTAHTFEDTYSLIPICGCSLEEAIRKLIDTHILEMLVHAIPNLGFEEKKVVRVILTNSMILEVNDAHLVVDYLCQPSITVLQTLVYSYEIGRSDVTLNCGCILRFASQYGSIVRSILESEYFLKFFDYMKQSTSNIPFDVAMDVFCTFKMLMTRHKSTTINVLKANPTPFFDAFIELLRYADQTENYVTKRQSLEIFSEIFSGEECGPIRALFIAQNRYICPVIVYLWNRNLQIRLRCLVLLNQLFRVTRTKDDQTIPNKCDDNSVPILSTKDSEPLWKLDLLITKIQQAQKNDCEQNKTQMPENLSLWTRDMLRNLRVECTESNIKHFTSQIPFIDRVLQLLHELSSINHVPS